jgi:hypothetical protein
VRIEMNVKKSYQKPRLKRLGMLRDRTHFSF